MFLDFGIVHNLTDFTKLFLIWYLLNNLILYLLYKKAI